MKKTALAAAILFGTVNAASAKQEEFFIERVALLATYQGVCGQSAQGEAMQTAIGSAMIKLAISKEAVISRAKKRARRIVDTIAANKTRNSFCGGFDYYLKNGYPK